MTHEEMRELEAIEDGLAELLRRVHALRPDGPPPPSVAQHWKRLHALVDAEHGSECVDCGVAYGTRLRRITFERGHYPEPADVRYLCEDCAHRRHPIPFFAEFQAKQWATTIQKDAARIARKAQEKLPSQWGPMLERTRRERLLSRLKVNP